MLGKCLTACCCSRLLFLWCIVPFYLAVLVNASNNNSSHIQLIYNLTLCELNGTDWLAQKFDWAVEIFVIFPVLTHIVSYGALTTSHFLDTVGLATVSTAGYYHRRYVLSSIYAVCALAALICFVIRLAKNCMSWRYSCTRYTNFLLDTKGRLYRWRSPVIVEKRGKVEVEGHLIDLKRVVLDGSAATPLTRVSAELWGRP
uniref:Major envelope glycoprotein n=1 Tax=Porcine reproductive and respiratory syndrome virus TaxID=28344 RepID=A0A0Y0CD93_PRRSV|nr:major envelope glycoprotein [Porcine reproductive and respiratory syndrome virus]AMB21438.1 major envelope glycoprotein [Porcine reproductive and respiratory syndrome virus]AMB21439.1 major envelope glycoprotein [Porcine reproductive and respiratory syndrome virus]AMB21440.1 major envelope glycoprotein [Porcine reproductive and respiratory syndrome virus]ANN46284.1 major envelope glycoprotein GP5 [Porcine reproductive and respiratory syndrome virus]